MSVKVEKRKGQWRMSNMFREISKISAFPAEKKWHILLQQAA